MELAPGGARDRAGTRGGREGRGAAMELAPGGARDPAMTRDPGQGAVPQWSWPPEGPETGPRVRGCEGADQRRRGDGPRPGPSPTPKNTPVSEHTSRRARAPRT